MGQAYTPGLQLSPRTVIRRIRELPIPGKALVSIGQTVQSNDDVLSTELPGDLDIIRVADRMGFDPEDVVHGIKVAVGAQIEKGDLLCEIKTFFNLFTNQLRAPRGGEVEFFTETNGHLGLRQPPIPLAVQAYISGKVVEVEEGKSVTIETRGTLAQGIFGVGGERQGAIYCLDVDRKARVRAETLESISTNLEGCVLVGGASFSIDALQHLAQRGVTGVVTGSIDAETLREYVGHDIGVSITGDEDVPATLIVTEGFGALPISERFFALMQQQQGKQASITGATQVRAGAMRPEVIVPHHETSDEEDSIASYALVVGTKVRIIRVPYFGEIGTVDELPPHPERIESGAKVRVLRVALENGAQVTVPRANVEIVQD